MVRDLLSQTPIYYPKWNRSKPILPVSRRVDGLSLRVGIVRVPVRRPDESRRPDGRNPPLSALYLVILPGGSRMNGRFGLSLGVSVYLLYLVSTPLYKVLFDLKRGVCLIFRFGGV